MQCPRDAAQHRKKKWGRGERKKRRATNDLECGYGRDTRELMKETKKKGGGAREDKEKRKK
jgi:hypothetical protein